MNYYGRLIVFVTAISVLGPISRAQSEASATPRHRHYKLFDLGTFGGAASGILFQPNILNRQGAVVGWSETSSPDPNAPNCVDVSCLVSHAFKWQDGKTLDLGALPGANSSGIPNQSASGIDERGVVIGSSETGEIDPLLGQPEYEAVMWKNGHIVRLGTLGGHFSLAIDLVENGDVIGGAANTVPDAWFGSGTEVHAFLWRNGVMHDLGTLGGPDSLATDINHRGQIAGFSLTNSEPNPTTGFPTTHAFLWEHGEMRDLGSLGGTSVDAGILNDRGQMIGGSTLAGDVDQHAFLWDGGELNDLGTLGGTFSTATDLNEKGYITGGATLPNDESIHAVLWKGKSIQDLGTVPGDECSQGWALDSNDTVVGISLPYPCDFSVAHAFIWERGSMADLNTLVAPHPGLQLVYAQGINDAGEIVGIGVPPGVSPADVEQLGHAYALVPISDEEFDREVRDAGDANLEVAARKNILPPDDAARAKVATGHMLSAIRRAMNRRHSLSRRVSGQR